MIPAFSCSYHLNVMLYIEAHHSTTPISLLRRHPSHTQPSPSDRDSLLLHMADPSNNDLYPHRQTPHRHPSYQSMKLPQTCGRQTPNSHLAIAPQPLSSFAPPLYSQHLSPYYNPANFLFPTSPSTSTEISKHRRSRWGCYICRKRRVKVLPNTPIPSTRPLATWKLISPAV